MATPGERDRLLGESLAGAGSSRLAASLDGKYYIYSSAHAAGGESAHTLAAGTNIDHFVTLLKDQEIILTAAPTDDNLVGELDGLDAWAGWMTCLDADGTLSLTFNNAKDQDITSFRYSFEQPWDMTFSSQADALLFAFGAQAGSNDARIPIPGLMPDGKLLYLALDPAATKNSLNSTVEDLVAFSGTDTAIPSAVADWKVVLDPSKASQKRNAMWFDPSSMQTTVRLQFTVVDGQQVLQTLLGGVLTGLAFDSVDAICKKTLVLAETESGAGAVKNGVFSLEVGCTATASKSPDPVQMIASIDCFQAGYSLSLQLTSKNALTGLLAWLSELVGLDNLDVIQDILNKGNIFDDLNPRRVQIGLDTDFEDGKTSIALSSFRVDIEVSALFGKSASQPVLFLVSYTWTKAIGGAGTLSGQFWNWFDASLTRDLSPAYESTEDIVPICIADNPAQTISILSLIPGQTIDNVPANIPTEIARAYFSLSQTGILLGGVIQSEVWSSPEEYSVPQLDLGVVTLSVSYAWGQAANFQFSLGVLVEMKPSTASKHQTSAYLKGSLGYSSQDKQWTLRAALDGLYASTLYEFFDEASADHVMPLIDSIEIANMELTYDYTAGKTAGKSAGSYFKFDGLLLIAALQLKLAFEHKDTGWTFSAQLAAQNGQATMGQVLQSILGDSNLDLPDFLANMPFDNKQGHAIVIEVMKGSSSQGSGGATFQFVASLSLGPLQLTFAQLHGSQWPATEPSKRLAKVALTELPGLDIALVGRLEQPFDEMYYMWIQDPTTQNKGQAAAGLTRADIVALNSSLTDHPLVAKDKFQTPKPEDLLMTAGSHFAIIINGTSGKTCILDYDFKKQTKTEETRSKATDVTATTEDTGAAESGEGDSDGSSSEAALKKKAGPLSISNIGLKYSDKTLRIKLDATMELGPLAFTLLGFSVNLKLTSLDLSKIDFPSFSLDGFSAELNKAPLTIAGIIRHGQDSTLNYYAGGLIVGWVPWQLEAAGFYGEATPQGAASFTSVFVFARLDGPLVTLEFAEISGVTGGFGYKSQLRVPTVDQVNTFPFVAPQTLDGATDNALQALERLTSPSQDGWFKPQDDTYWGAAGMKIDALGMISLDAVVVVQFGASVKIGIFGVALADIPSAKSPIKLAHVELGIAVTVDPDVGLLQVEAQLSPNSYILNPSCHLTGGFALCYWYDGPHANKDLIGNFVFTLGGYHQAFPVPKGWPNPPRLGISWSLGKFLSISGEAFFAITPKACMAGGRLKASFSAGPLAAWFDAFANFLINYKPFHFYAEAGICVGVSFNIDFLFIHIHISVEISADLDLWGPPMAGSVHIDIKIATVTVKFGDHDSGPLPVSLLDFYHLALQASSQQQQSLEEPAAAVAETEADTQPPNQGHVFLAQSGLMNDSDKPDRAQNQAWIVRGGTFSCVVGCKVAIGSAALVDQDGKTLNSVAYTDNAIYAKPMHLKTPLQSDLQIEIVQDNVPDDDAKWGMDKVLKSVPTGLWAMYDESKDPASGGGGNNNIDDLLKSDGGGVTLMMGVLLTAPPPVLSQDRLPVFDIADASLEEIDGNPFPTATPSQDTWKPDTPASGSEQWDAVHGKWKTPSWDSGAGDSVQKQFVQTWSQAFNWDGALAQLAQLPKLLDKRFNEIYLAAPLMTK